MNINSTLTWGEIPENVKHAMATVLVFLKRNNFTSYHMDDDGKNYFFRKQTEQELQEIQEANRRVRESFETDFPNKSGTGYIYLVASETGYYKIGRALKLDERINQFGVKLPFKTWLAHSFVSDDYKQAEKLLHERYAEKRSHGEWFLLSENDVQEICTIQDGQL